MALHPTPNGTDCPICKEKECLLYAVDFTKYYRVTALTSERVAGYYENSKVGDDCRLFCDSCGEYFELPEEEDFIGD